MEGLSSASVLWEMKLQQAAQTAAWVIPGTARLFQPIIGANGDSPCKNSNGRTSQGLEMKEM